VFRHDVLAYVTKLRKAGTASIRQDEDLPKITDRRTKSDGYKRRPQATGYVIFTGIGTTWLMT
jgi:hypothetical protein